MSEAVQSLSYTTLGGAVVFAVLWAFWAAQKRAAKRSDSEATLDDRAVKIVSMSDSMLDDVRVENKELRVELFKAYERSFQTLQAQQEIVNKAVEQVRAEYMRDIAAVKADVKECQAQHAECERRQEWTMNQLQELRGERGFKLPTVDRRAHPPGESNVP